MSIVYQYCSSYCDKNLYPALREPEQCYNSGIDDPLDTQQQHAKDLERIRNFRLIDDDFMTAVFSDKASAELLIRIILHRDDLTVIKAESQHVLKNLQGRSVRLDIYAEDNENNAYDIEVQRDDKGAGVRRARYNSSLMDANITSSGDDYNDLPETVIIFITERDVFGDGLPIYHLDRYVNETGRRIDDGSHIIYVNSQIRDNTTDLGRLMHDFWCTNHQDMHYQVLSDRVRHFKTEEEGQTNMCEALEQMRNEVAKAKSIKIAKSLLVGGKLTYEEIADSTELTLQEVQALADRQPA